MMKTLQTGKQQGSSKPTCYMFVAYIYILVQPRILDSILGCTSELVHSFTGIHSDFPYARTMELIIMWWKLQHSKSGKLPQLWYVVITCYNIWNCAKSSELLNTLFHTTNTAIRPCFCDPKTSGPGWPSNWSISRWIVPSQMGGQTDWGYIRWLTWS